MQPQKEQINCWFLHRNDRTMLGRLGKFPICRQAPGLLTLGLLRLAACTEGKASENDASGGNLFLKNTRDVCGPCIICICRPHDLSIAGTVAFYLSVPPSAQPPRTELDRLRPVLFCLSSYQVARGSAAQL